MLTFRFTTGAVLVGLLCGRKWRTRFTPDYVWRGAVLGSLLFAAYAVQTFGLVGTTPSKNAFLTATYCVLVPFLHWAVSRQRPDRFHLLAAFLCITGVGLVSLNGSLTITWGDLLSLGSALFYALHIVAVNKLSDRRDIYLLTSLQFAFTALLAVIGGLLDDVLLPGQRPDHDLPQGGFVFHDQDFHKQQIFFGAKIHHESERNLKPRRQCPSPNILQISGKDE